MRKLLVIITVIILAFTFFYSCTTQVEKPNDSRIEKPDPDQDPEPEPEPEELPDTPNNLRATSVTYDTIVLEWDTVSNATEYKVVLKHMSGNTIQEFIVSENTFEFTRRNSGMWYDLEVWSGDSERLERIACHNQCTDPRGIWDSNFRREERNFLVVYIRQLLYYSLSRFCRERF